MAGKGCCLRLLFQVGNGYFKLFYLFFFNWLMYLMSFLWFSRQTAYYLVYDLVDLCELLDLSICLFSLRQSVNFPLNLNVFHYFNHVFLPSCRWWRVWAITSLIPDSVHLARQPRCTEVPFEVISLFIWFNYIP